MSAEAQSGAGRREVAYRLFAAEYDDASLEYSEADEERAPNYVITPTGARVNRLFVVGVLTEVEEVSEDVLRGRVVDPTGAFVVYAGQYQPDAQTFLERATPPMFVAVTGKARTFRPEGSDRVLTSVRPESINEVTAEIRDRWTVQAAEHTVDRVATFAAALSRPERGEDLRDALLDAGVDFGLASGIPLAIDHYGTTTGYLAAVRRMAIEAAEVVTDERDEVSALDLAPDEGGEAPIPAADLGAESAEPGAGTTGRDGGDEGEIAEPESSLTEESTIEAEGTVETEEPEGTVETEEPIEAANAAETDDLGDFDDYGTDAEPAVDAGEVEPDVGEVETDEMYELDDEEREAIEEEYGTEFNTGTEVESPGEADIETPEPDSIESGEDDVAPAEVDMASEPEADSEEVAETQVDAGVEPEPEPEIEDEPEPELEIEEQPEPEDEGQPEAEASTEEGTEAGTEEPPAAEDVDVEEAAVEAMRELDAGDGADREAVIEAVVEEYGVADEEIEEAIQDALMSGKCYEPDEGRLKAI